MHGRSLLLLETPSLTPTPKPPGRGQGAPIAMGKRQRLLQMDLIVEMIMGNRKRGGEGRVRCAVIRGVGDRIWRAELRDIYRIEGLYEV